MTTNKPPVLIIEGCGDTNFQAQCAAAVQDGYVLSSSSCGNADAQYNFCAITIALFVLPTVTVQGMNAYNE